MNEEEIAEAKFIRLVGVVIHQCGTIELLVNSAIRRLSKATRFKKDVLHWNLTQRITVLEELLRQEGALDAADIYSLCNGLRDVARQRNNVAHNPIAKNPQDSQPGYFIILLAKKPKPKPGQKAPPLYDKMTQQDIERLVEKARTVRKELERRCPYCTQWEWE